MCHHSISGAGGAAESRLPTSSKVQLHDKTKAAMQRKGIIANSEKGQALAGTKLSGVPADGRREAGAAAPSAWWRRRAWFVVAVLSASTALRNKFLRLFRQIKSVTRLH